MSHFDKYANNYDRMIEEAFPLGLRGRRDAIVNSKVDWINKLTRIGNTKGMLLDYGGGSGEVGEAFARRYPALSVTVYDPSSKMLDAGISKCRDIGNITFTDKLSRDMKYDVVLAVNVFHHIKLEERSQAMRNILSCALSGGKVAVIEHNPWNMIARYIVRRCVLDKGARLLSSREVEALACAEGWCSKCRYIMPLPCRGEMFKLFENWMSILPLGVQYISLIYKVAGSSCVEI